MTREPKRGGQLACLLALLGWLSIGAHPLIAQSPEDLVAAAARAMQEQDYAAAERHYRALAKALPEAAEVHSNLALACKLQGKTECAELASHEALRRKEDLFLPHFLLGEIEFQRNRYEQALKHLAAALWTHPEQPEARRLYLATLVGLGRYTEAIEQYEVALRANPSDVEALFALGTIYMDLGQKTISRLGEVQDQNFGALLSAEHAARDEGLLLALNHYEDAFASRIDVEGARVRYAQLRISNVDLAQARDLLTEELQRDSQSYEARWHLARLALADGDAGAAAALVDEAARIRPEFFASTPKLDLDLPAAARGKLEVALQPLASETNFGAAFLLSQLLSQSDRAAEAQEPSRQAQAALDAIAQSVRGKAEQTASQATDALVTGLDLLTRKRYEEGLTLLIPLAGKGPLPAEPSLSLERALFRLGRYQQLVRLFSGHRDPVPEMIYLLGRGYREMALEKLSRMVELDPESVRAHQVLGDAFFAQERYVDAATEYQRSLRIEPKNPELHFLLGNSYYKQMQFGLSQAAFATAVELDPLHAEGHMMLADSLLQLGRNEEAIPLLEKSLALRAPPEEANILLGKAYRAIGDWEKALLHTEKGAPSDKDGSVHYQLFVIYRRLNQPEKAQQALKKSQELRRKTPSKTL